MEQPTGKAKRQRAKTGQRDGTAQRDAAIRLDYAKLLKHKYKGMRLHRSDIAEHLAEKYYLSKATVNRMFAKNGLKNRVLVPNGLNL